ncbi:MAG TPA: ABC transporter permease [Flavobacteriales bacterium]|nr:ABC transporter permease [Flavobacteriales bacterium]HRJ38708.1 ABC transporter permease [Flavobacteriales bacterium]
MGKIGLIIGREYLTRVRKPSFIIMTLLGPILIGVFLTLTIWLTIGESGSQKVLVVDELGLTHQVFKDKPNVVEFDYRTTHLEAKEFLEGDQYDLALYINKNTINGDKALLLYKKIPSLSIQSYINSELDAVMESYRLMKANTGPEVQKFINEEYPKIKRHIELETKNAESGEKAKTKHYAAVVGYVFALLIYMFIFLYGVQVMRGVIEEKTNRIVEIIISSVKPFELMLGKIIGIAMVGLTQFILWVLLTGLILILAQSLFFPDFYDAANQANFTQVANGISPEQAAINFESNEIYDLIFIRINWALMLFMFLFYFIGGYLMYSALFAAIGAAVDSESDTQQFMMPITIPLVFGFIVAQMAIENPESNAVFWSSMIPFTSPVVMMVRVAMGFEPGTIWQLYLSMALLVAGFITCTWIAGKIYRTGILMYGKKVSYKELFKWMFYKG